MYKNTLLQTIKKISIFLLQLNCKKAKGLSKLITCSFLCLWLLVLRSIQAYNTALKQTLYTSSYSKPFCYHTTIRWLILDLLEKLDLLVCELYIAAFKLLYFFTVHTLWLFLLRNTVGNVWTGAENGRFKRQNSLMKHNDLI